MLLKPLVLQHKKQLLKDSSVDIFRTNLTKHQWFQQQYVWKWCETVGFNNMFENTLLQPMVLHTFYNNVDETIGFTTPPNILAPNLLILQQFEK